MVREAEQYAEEDRKAKEAVEVRNQGETLVHSTETFVAENGDKVSDDVKSEVQADVDALKEALNGDDIEGIKAAISKLGTSSQKMGTAMYEAAAQQQGATSTGTDGAAGSHAGDDEDVVEAEIVDDEGENK
jgi:molecular chaperone DnaK